MAADPSYDPTEFQEVLRAWMDRNGLSQMAAGQTIGISQGIINRWLKPPGDPYLVQPTVDSLEKLTPHLRVPLVQLKRMTNNLSAADLELLTAVKADRPNNRLEALLSDIRAAWSELEQSEPPQVLEQAEDVTRAAWRLHHNRSRRSRKVERDEPSESGRNSLMRFGAAIPVLA